MVRLDSNPSFELFLCADMNRAFYQDLLSISEQDDVLRRHGELVAHLRHNPYL